MASRFVVQISTEPLAGTELVCSDASRTLDILQFLPSIRCLLKYSAVSVSEVYVGGDRYGSVYGRPKKE